jgi:glycosyltransferase involved in cell wall biosynthesis
MADALHKRCLIGISATNPCHLYDLACALHRQGELGVYHSGYPAWKLNPPSGLPLRAHSWRTVITYSWRRLPLALRPADHRLFRWQDDGFDRAVAANLQPGDGAFIHALPGQARDTFTAARRLGLKTVLNHASGPTKLQAELLVAEYRRAGVAQHHPGLDPTYRAREDREYEIADFHVAASSLVRQQLISAGVDAAKIWVVPYAANPRLFHRPSPNAARNHHQIVFAGQLTQRKGLRLLIDAARSVRQSHEVRLDLYGPISPDIIPDLVSIKDTPWIKYHGAVSQAALGNIFQKGSLLVLPSWEEAFGLVVPQALNCGLPCVVSDRVGARDLIEPYRNGSVFPAGDTEALAREIGWWLDHRDAFSSQLLTWDAPAAKLIELMRRQNIR